MPLKACAWCGGPFQPHRPSNRFCSQACHGRSREAPLTDRIMSRLECDPNSGCWLWSGAVNRKGYGLIGVGQRTALVHRALFECTNGPIPDGLQACHRCDTPACANPDHIFLGSGAENVADMVRKGRQVAGERQRVAKLTTEAAREIMSSEDPASLLAALYGVDRATIYCVQTGRSWRRATEATNPRIATTAA